MCVIASVPVTDTRLRLSRLQERDKSYGASGPAGTTPIIKAQNPLLYSGIKLTIDLTSYAIKQYVDDAIATLQS